VAAARRREQQILVVVVVDKLQEILVAGAQAAPAL
jgi:hypothetical protein